MVVLLGLGGTAKMGGGEWRATAAFVTCCSSFLRVGLLLLENGAYVHPLFEVCVCSGDDGSGVCGALDDGVGGILRRRIGVLGVCCI